MSLSMVVGTIEIDVDEKCGGIAGNFDHHADAAVPCGVHRLMERIPGFTRSHWMPPFRECLRRITQVATMVYNFG